MKIPPYSDVDTVIRKIRKLPSLPPLIMEIMASINNDRIAVASLVKKISQDQALVARVMRVANSPFFGLSGQIGSIEKAVTILGFNSLRGLITAAGFINAFPQVPNSFDHNGFWRHSIGSAIWSKLLAARSRQDPETAFTAGLLHETGTLVMVVYFPEEFDRVRQLMMEGMGPEDAERAVFGLDQALLGARVSEHWNFPAEICEAIREHNNPLKLDGKTTLADVVYIANLADRSMRENGVTADGFSSISVEVLMRLGIDSEAMSILAKEAERLQAGAFMLLNK